MSQSAKRAMDHTYSENGSKSDQVPVPETTLAEKLRSFMKNKGDVTFIVGEGKEEIKASSIILSALSPVFEAMFSERWKKTSQIVPIPDVDPKMFDIFLKLTVTENLKRDNIQKLKLSTEEVLHLLYVAKKYDVNAIEKCCRETITKMATVEHAASVFEAIETSNESSLQQEVFGFIEKNADQIFKTKEFLATSRETLIKILESDGLRVEEIDVFKAIHKWTAAELTKKGEIVSGKKIRECFRDVIALIRFPVISSRDLVLYVKPTGILTDTEYTRLLEYNALLPGQARSSNLKDINFNARPRSGCKRTTKVTVSPIVKRPTQKKKRGRIVLSDSDYSDSNS